MLKVINMEIIKVELYQPEVVIVAELAKEIWYEHYEPIIGPEQVKYMLTRFQTQSAINMQIHEGYRYCLLKDESGYVGYFSYRMETPKPTMFLSKLYVKKDARGKGYSRQALKYIEERGIEEGMSRIYLTVNKHNALAIEAYRHLGFKKNGSLIQDIGEGFRMNDYFFEKEI